MSTTNGIEWKERRDVSIETGWMQMARLIRLLEYSSKIVQYLPS